MQKKGRGGRRKNQRGRPPKPDTRKERIGTLYLLPKAAARLKEKREGTERLITTAARLLYGILE